MTDTELNGSYQRTGAAPTQNEWGRQNEKKLKPIIIISVVFSIRNAA